MSLVRSERHGAAAVLTLDRPDALNALDRATLEALEARKLVIEAEGALIVIPFENVKYLQVYPAPKKLPAGVIRGASFKD